MFHMLRIAPGLSGRQGGGRGRHHGGEAPWDTHSIAFLKVEAQTYLTPAFMAGLPGLFLWSEWS